MCKKKVLRALCLCAIGVTVGYLPVLSQIKWDGGGDDGLWSTPANWSNNLVPSSTDSIVFDKSFISGNYIVTIPGAATAKVIVIASGIELIIPSSNKSVPALTVNGSIIVNGVLRNASGADSGQTIIISDSLRINNGGRYIHQTERSHAAFVTKLSRSPGTEEGIFEFDAPGTLSLSGRVFGKLVLSSSGTYTASGTSGCTINRDLIIGDSVTLSLNMSDTLLVKRDLIQRGGTINLGNSTRKLVTVINRHITQKGLITETSSAIPEIILNGKENQQLNCAGLIQNSIAISINNPQGARLLAPLSLPYSLQLKLGAVTTTNTALLTILPGCTLQFDKGFIDGPLHMQALSPATRYILPLGKNKTIRWLALNNASGDVTAEFIPKNPQLLSSVYSTGIDHIMGTEYWSIKAAAAAAIELSFTGMANIDVADLSALRVAWLNGSNWVNAGQAKVTGSASAGGTVVSELFTNWSNVAVLFALASAIPPEELLSLEIRTPPRPSANAPIHTNRLQLQGYAAASDLITCLSPEKTSLTICMVNSAGMRVSATNYFVQKGINKLLLNTRTLPAGIYCVQAFSATRRSNVFRLGRL